MTGIARGTGTGGLPPVFAPRGGGTLIPLGRARAMRARSVGPLPVDPAGGAGAR